MGDGKVVMILDVDLVVINCINVLNEEVLL